MLDQVNLLEILPARDVTDEVYLTEAEGEIRGYGRLVVSGIIAIGKKLSEIRTRVGHGRYGEFIKRLGFSHSTAQNFVQSYELLTKFANFANLESLQIDATALYLLARPSTSDEVRTVALEKAATEGISHAEVQRLMAEAQRKTKEAVDAEAAEELAAVKRASEEAARTAADQSAALADRNRQSEAKIARGQERIAELEAAAATVAQSVRADVEAQYAGKIIIGEDELSTQVKAAMEASTAPLDNEIAAQKKQIAELEEQVRDRDKEIADICRKQAEAMKVAVEKAEGEAKEPPLPPVDTKLSFDAMKARNAILHCVGEIGLSPAECIAIEVAVATRLQQRPDMARENLGEVATAIQLLSPWFEKFTELYETEINRHFGRDEVTPVVASIPPAATETESTESPPPSLEMTGRSASPVAAPDLADQREQDPPPKRRRGRPPGSRNKRPRQRKNAPPPIDAEQSPDFGGEREIEAAQLQTHNPESAEAEMRDTGTEQPAEGLTH
jgi:hypothetical protein